MNGADYNLSIKTIFYSFSLVSGVGYVWIVRIYLCMAVIAPLLKIASDRSKSDWVYFALVLSGFGCYSLALYLIKELELTGLLKNLIDTCIIPIFGYAIAYFIGIRCRQMKNSVRVALCVVFAVIVGCWCAFGGYTHIISDKYPPGSHYLAWGILCSLLLFGCSVILRVTGS